MEIFRIENLTFRYPGGGKPALDGVSFTLRRGEFVTLCGPSGCGKTTLLRQLKPVMTPHGEKSGAVFFEGAALEGLPPREQATAIGYVQQSPDNQIVTDKVWHELAFGLESLGVKTPEIRRRVAEMASFFGIEGWFHRDVGELSGGQKQLLNLASVMVMQPRALILDEPTSQLDPIAAGAFVDMVGKINRELGVTVILTEHRLEEALPLSGRALVMVGGRILADAAPREAALALRAGGHPMFAAMPAATRIWSAVEVGDGPPPLTVGEGAAWLAGMRDKAVHPLPEAPPPAEGGPAVRWEDVWFKYGQNGPDVLKGLSFTARYGEVTALLGGNGAGKTTALSLVSGLHAPQRGAVRAEGTLGVLPQNPQALFVKKTVREDLLEILSERRLSKAEQAARLAQMSALCRLDDLLDSHPYDLSGGEQQRAALAKVLLLRPKILLLDEPTKGLDADFKQVLAGILKRLTAAGAAVILVSHDVEFCAEYAGRCALMFDGAVVSEGDSRAFFSGNNFYTTAANRMARGVIPGAVTADDVVAVLGGQLPGRAEDAGDCAAYVMEEAAPPAPKAAPPKLSRRRKALAALPALWLVGTAIFGLFYFDGLKAFISGGSAAMAAASSLNDIWRYSGILVAFAAALMALVLILTWGREPAVPRPAGRRLTRRTLAAALMIVLAIPLTIYVGSYFLDDRKYYFISLLVILETMVPFVLVFEQRKPQARELMVIAVLCAMAVAGRVAFFMLPQFKPVVALVIISGVAMGGEAGFLVGALAGFVSNFYFGQGPYTPWQMFAFGVIGFLAGVLFRRGLLGRGRVPLAIFGGIATFAIYGGIMNPATVIIFQPHPTAEMFWLAYLQGIPFDLVHAAATVTFMLLLSQTMLEKLDRIKMKYGLLA